MFELKLKTSEIDLLCALINWQPMGLLERTIKGNTLLIVPSRENENVSFMLSSPLSSCIYVKGVDWNGWRNLHSHPFLKHDAEWNAECFSNLYFSNVSRMQFFFQNGSNSKAQPPLMRYKKVYQMRLCSRPLRPTTETTTRRGRRMTQPRGAWSSHPVVGSYSPTIGIINI